jgi:hypothetical protein
MVKTVSCPSVLTIRDGGSRISCTCSIHPPPFTLVLQRFQPEIPTGTFSINSPLKTRLCGGGKPGNRVVGRYILLRCIGILVLPRVARESSLFPQRLGISTFPCSRSLSFSGSYLLSCLPFMPFQVLSQETIAPNHKAILDFLPLRLSRESCQLRKRARRVGNLNALNRNIVTILMHHDNLNMM